MSSTWNKIDQTQLQEAKELLWGGYLKDEIFCRWTQGFVFSEIEPSALVQFEGGPCAVLAPVQAYLIKTALFNESPKEDLSSLTEEEVSEILVCALCQILTDLSSNSYTIISIETEESLSPQSENEPSVSNASETSSDQTKSHNRDQNTNEPGECSPKRQKFDQELFHSKLRCKTCEDEESLHTCVKSNMSQFTGCYGVLLFLYSIVLSKGVEQIKNEVEDPGESLIDNIHGHGSQSLINLFISGKAVTNVWDNDKEVCGLKLCGIHSQATIGFLTLLEHMRYCEDRGLVVVESPETNAKHVFQTFDPEGNGFISTEQLGEIMSALNLVSEKEYVDIMKTKLDSESLGIITMNCFMEEFFPGESSREMPPSFTFYHYNGLPRSNPQKKVQYISGKAAIPEELDVQIITDISTIKMCLETKWSQLELTWNGDAVPSLN